MNGAPTLLLSPLTLGPRSPRRGHAGNVRRIARTMRASSLHAQGCAFNEPRHDLANRSEAAARRPGCVLLTPGILPFAASRPAPPFAPLLRRSGYFLLHKQEKVTRAPDARGKVKGCGNKRIKKRLDSRLRGNDERR